MLIVLTAGHGELLYSHPSDYLTFDHLFDTVLHVPLIMARPGIPKGREIGGLASNVDTAPTVLELPGLPPLPDAEGQSLIPLIQGEKESLNTYVYGEEDLMPLYARSGPFITSSFAISGPAKRCSLTWIAIPASNTMLRRIFGGPIIPY